MKIRGFAILGTGMLAAALAAAACQSSNSSTPSTGGTGGTGTGGTGTGGTGTGGTGTGGNGGTAGTGTGGSAGTGTGGSAGAANCAFTQTATVQDLNANSIAAKTYVKLSGVVATSQKFLVSQSSSGSCLWAVFVSAPVTQAAPNTGLMVISYGPNVTTTEAGTVGTCQSGQDGIPDDIQPGQTFDVIGAVSPYAPSTCAGTAPEMQVRVPASCPMTKTGSTTPPTPATLDTATADQIAAGTDTTLANKWGGVLMRLSNVDATVPDGGTSIVQKYGVITFQQTAIEAHDKLFYYDLTGAGPKGSGKGWQYATATHFNRLDGIIYLDYCTWSLNPRNKCTDVDPASDDCSGG